MEWMPRRYLCSKRFFSLYQTCHSLWMNFWTKMYRNLNGCSHYYIESNERLQSFRVSHNCKENDEVMNNSEQNIQSIFIHICSLWWWAISVLPMSANFKIPVEYLISIFQNLNSNLKLIFYINIMKEHLLLILLLTIQMYNMSSLQQYN